MTADEFLVGIQGFDELSDGLQSDLLAAYLLLHGGAKSVSAASISSLREALRLPEHGRLPQYLSENSRKRGTKRPRYVRLDGGYALERGYLTSLQKEHLGRRAVKHLAVTLRGTLAAIGDPAVKSYLEEGVAAFEHGHHRAALILSWCVAYGLVRDWLFRNHLALLNAEMATWKKPAAISRLEDFQELTEGLVLDTARKRKALSKEEHKTLKQLLDTRNSYAHPTTKPISPAIVEAYIDTIIREVLPAFG
jgi:hypothetical protein